MIPVTSFAGRKVAVFGLAAWLAGASALWPAVPTWSAGTTAPIPWRRRPPPAFPPPICSTSTGRGSPRWCSPRGAADPSGAALVGGAGARRRGRGDRRHRAYLAASAAATPSTRRSSPSPAPTENRPPPRSMRNSSAPPDTTSRSAAISAPRSLLEPPRMGRVHVIASSHRRSTWRRRSDPSVGILITVSEDHLDRHGTLARYAAVKERLPPACRRTAPPSSAWTTTAPGRGRPHRARRQAGGARLGAAGRRPLCRGRADHVGRRRHRPIARAAWRIGCRAAHTPRTPFAPPARRWRSTCRYRRSAGWRRPGLPTAEQVGRQGRVFHVNDSKATNADSAAQALACFSDISDRCRWQAEDRRLPRSPASSRASARLI